MRFPSSGALARLNEEQRREYWACLALRHTPGVGARSWGKLLETFGSAYAAVHNTEEWSRAGIACRAAGVRDGSWRTAARREWEAARMLNADIVLWTDPRYPERLRELPDPPLLLYARGRLSLLQADGVAVVGMRRCSPEGRKAASLLAGGLSRAGIVVVSGLARGVDREAHLAALSGPGGSVAVLGTGIDATYPRCNADLYAAMRSKGLIVSEFAPGTPPSAGNFPVRNRIISGLCLGVAVVEALPRSGSLITAGLALEQNRSVYAVPGSVGSVTSAGCRNLIRQGAHPIFEVADILADLGPLLRAGASLRAEPVPGGPPTAPAAPAETSDPPDSPEFRILDALSRDPVLDMDTLCRSLNLPVSTVSVALLRLELRRKVRRAAGNTYTPV